MKKIKIIIFTIIVLLCSLLVNTKLNLHGDGSEYLTMALSFKNHLSPLKTPDDKQEVLNILSGSSKFEYKKNEVARNSGYYSVSAGGGGQYSYHFWFYSLLCTPALAILSKLNINPIYGFRITNLLMIILLFWWILFRNKAMDDKSKLFLSGLTFLSPLWFYYSWPHPEVFTFVFLYIGLLEYYNKHKYSAVFFSSLSSVQNPAAAMIPFFMLVKEFVELLKEKTKEKLLKFVSLSAISTIVLIPYIFYYVHYKKFSLIAEYATDLKSISFAKISSLFFDLNFGLIIFIPVLFAIFVYLIFKKDKNAIAAACVLFLFAVIDSAQLNWNPGIMLLNRYSYWMIPVMLFGCFDYFQKISDKKRIIIFALTVITILPWLLYSTSSKSEDAGRMQPVANLVLSTVPALYNPQNQIFLRALDGPWDGNYPVYFKNNGRITKGLFYDKEKNKTYYVNYPVVSSDFEIKIRHKNKIYYIGTGGIRKEILGK